MKGKALRRRAKKAKYVVSDNKVRKDCKMCGIELPKNSRHHAKCHSCWITFQQRKGNIALIKGVK